MLLLDVTIVNVALPDIQSQFDASLSDLQWVIDAYALSLAALLLTAGSLADLFGRRRVFVIGTALFTLGSIAVRTRAQDIVFLAIARAFQGIGGAAMFATVARAPRLGVPGSRPRRRVRRVRRDHRCGRGGRPGARRRAHQRPVVALDLLRQHPDLPGRDRHRADPGPGVAGTRAPGGPTGSASSRSASALGLLVYGLIRAGQDGWGDTRVVTCLVVSAVLLAAFVVSQLLQKDPMFDLTLLRKPTFTGGLLAAFGVSASIFSLLTYLVIYLQNVLGYSAVETGLRFLFLSAATFVASAIAGRLIDHVPTKWLIGPGFVVLGIGLLLIGGIDVDSAWTHLIPGLIVCGIGVGMINPPLASTAVGVVAPARAGMASGVNSTFRQVGIATGIAALGSIFSHQVGRRPARQAGRYAGRGSVGPDRRARSPAARSTPSSSDAPAGVRAHDRGRRDLELRRRAQPHHDDRRGHRRSSSARCAWC